MNKLNNMSFRNSGTVLFDQTSFWLIIGVIAIFIAGTAFGRMSDSKSTDSVSRSEIAAPHHTVYGRFGELHWAH